MCFLIYLQGSVQVENKWRSGFNIIEMSKVLQHLQIDQDTFLWMCIAAGCDHLKNIRAIGIRRAKEIVIQDGFLEKLSGLANAPANYMADFRRTELVFRHQTVLNIVDNCLAPLHPWTNEEPSNEDVNACGQYPFNVFLI